LNFLIDCGAFVEDKDGTFSVDRAKVKDGAKTLTRELMTLEAEGNYAGAKDLLARLGVLRLRFRQWGGVFPGN